MAAGLGFKTFTTGEVLTAADTNGYLMQGVLVFASAAARDAAITSPQEGQCCYLKDTDAVLTYSGAAWVGFDDSNAIQNTIVDAKGDIVAASGSDTPARLAVGNNGETLVADSSTSTGLRYQVPVNANPVLNSAFQVWQRGTSFVPSTTGGTSYTADRWSAYRNATGSTVTRQVTGDTTNLPFIQYCARVSRDSGNTSTQAIILGNPFEIANAVPYAGKTVTLSFYARKGATYSATSNALSVVVLAGTGSTETNPMFSGYTGQYAPLNTSVTLTNTWQRFTQTFSFASADTQFEPYFQFTPTGTAGATDYFEVTGVQLEVGSVATPFKTYAGTLQGELAACQRYYWRNTTGSTFGVLVNAAAFRTTTAVDGQVVFPVPMRINPTSMDWSAWTFRQYDGSTFTTTLAAMDANTATPLTCLVTGTVSGGTAGRFGSILSNNTTSGYIGFSAEL